MVNSYVAQSVVLFVMPWEVCKHGRKTDDKRQHGAAGKTISRYYHWS